MKIKENGITLIALVITIVVLVILAEISIASLTGSGIFAQTQLAKEKNKYTSAKEEIIIKLMEISIEKQNVYTIVDIANNMKEADNITIEKYFNSEVAAIKPGITEELTNLKAIAVSVDEYSEYKFLLGKECKISGVLEGEIVDTTQETDFKDVVQFEKEKFNISVESSTGTQTPGPEPEPEPEPEVTLQPSAWYDGINNTNEGHSYEAEEWTDLTGNNTDGATINGATWIDNGLLFDGTNDWVDLNSILMPEEDNFTIDLVFSLNSRNVTADAHYFILAQNQYSYSTYRTGIKYDTDSAVEVFNGGSESEITSGYNPQLTERVNVTLVRNGDNLEIWINGIKKGEQTIVDLKIDQINTVLGRWGNTSTMYFNGIIYSVKAYNKGLNEEEIQKNYQENIQRYVKQKGRCIC